MKVPTAAIWLLASLRFSTKRVSSAVKVCDVAANTTDAVAAPHSAKPARHNVVAMSARWTPAIPK